MVVLDEAQTLPLRLLRPCMAALNELAANYRTSVVLCTATQPALRVCDGFKDETLAPKQPRQKVGFDIDDGRELAPDPQELYTALKRVEIERRPDQTTDAEIVARFAEQAAMLCIVNSRRHARDLFDLLKADPHTAEGALHLTTLMCPVHRRAVLAEVMADSIRMIPKPVRLVATSLIEAGVDIDFPEVWRAMAGLDSIAQAAGRCNREGRLERGRVVVFEPADKARASRPAAADRIGRRRVPSGAGPALHGRCPRLFFARFTGGVARRRWMPRHWTGRPWPILQAIAERAAAREFDFETIAQVFRLIDDAQETAIVPYDDEAVAVLARVAVMDRPRAADLRKLQQYAVSIPEAGPGCVARSWRAPCGESRKSVRRCCASRTGRITARKPASTCREPERRDAAANLI